MSRAIVTYAAGAHEELLEIAAPGYKDFAARYGYEYIVGTKLTDLPPAWNKIPLLMSALQHYDEVVWFDCDLVIVNATEDLPPPASTFESDKIKPTGYTHAMVRHLENDSEVPNSGVWRVTKEAAPVLDKILELEVFRNHGWWEQAALMTLMGYTVPPEGSEFSETKCRNVVQTKWYKQCQFMRLSWNSHPNYRSDRPRIIHCSYPNMIQRVEVMRELVKNPTYEYPRYDTVCPYCMRSNKVEQKKEGV